MTNKDNSYCNLIPQQTSTMTDSAFLPSHLTPGFEGGRLLEKTATAMEELLVLLVPWIGIDSAKVT